MPLISSILQNHPEDRAAIIVPDGPTVTYGHLKREVDRVAGLLAGAGVEPGRPVSIVLGNDVEFMTTFLAVAQAGAVAAPLNPAYTAAEFEFFMQDADSQLALLPPSQHASREAANKLGIKTADAWLDGTTVKISVAGTELTATGTPTPPRADATALFLHTSGTTSRPKGVPLTHGNLLASLRNISETYRLDESDVAMVVMPLFHVHGLIGVALSTLFSGGTIVLPPRFSASTFWPTQRQTGATWYSGVPTIHKILLDKADADGAPEKSFRFIRSCSAPMSPVAIAAVEARFGAPFLEAYGMTEASHQMSSNPLPPGDRRPGTVGAGTGVGVSIRDESGNAVPAGQQGEVCVSGPNVTHGYANNPEANATAFWGEWFRTGDQGVLAPDGYLTLTGRLKELINRAGEKISPLEVDEALLGHPAVAEAVSFAVPDPMYGECVHAAVVLSGEATEDEIKAFCAQKLASFKVPDSIYIAEELPRTATGKIQRRHVAAKFAG
jgi:acyl-CoA synthetase (AMP-forming)/AMP-acid ligase II